MKSPHVLNLCLAVGHLLVNLYQFFLLPLFLLPRSGWWALTLVPLAALNNPLWALIHETIHGSFHPSPRMNRAVGRALAIVFGSPLRVLSVGHLLHHKFNRTPLDRVEAYDSRAGSRLAAAVGYYYQLLVGLYLSQLLTPLAFFLPRRLLQAARRRVFTRDTYAGRAAGILVRDEAVRAVRVDGALILAFLALSAASYGARWWLLGGILGLRCVCISFLDYVYHYGSPIDRVTHAYNLRLPRPLSWLLLHFNLHGVHHRDPRLPWSSLPAAFARQAGWFDGDYFGAAARQFRGPIPLSALPSRLPGAAAEGPRAAQGSMDG